MTDSVRCPHPNRRSREDLRNDFDQKAHRGKKWYVPGIFLPQLARLGLQLTGQIKRAEAEARDFEIVRRVQPVRGLPSAFEGKVLLQLSDFHVDNQPDLGERLAPITRDLKCDKVLLTGDFTDGFNELGKGIEPLLPVLNSLPAPAIAVLGNHDRFSLIPVLETLGIEVLYNSSTEWELEGQKLFFVGVDDAGFYKGDDLNSALLECPQDSAWILLSHDPRNYREAVSRGAGAMISGHTHGGQLCLPGGYPITGRCPIPRRMISGSWSHEGMPGYTHRGTGCGSYPLRLNCRPEITLHTLQSST